MSDRSGGMTPYRDILSNEEDTIARKVEMST